MDTTRTLRLTAAAIVAFAILPLSGCLGEAPPSSSEETKSAETESESPSAEMPDALPLDAAADVPESATIKWEDNLKTDDDWEVDYPVDDNGQWRYATVDGTCTATFWQGSTSDIETTPGDDRGASDALLAPSVQLDTPDVTERAIDGIFSYQSVGNRNMEQRSFTSSSFTGEEPEPGERNWIMAARAFTAVDTGVMLVVDCTGADSKRMFAEVVFNNPVLVN